jgi:hypothetical protein
MGSSSTSTVPNSSPAWAVPSTVAILWCTNQAVRSLKPTLRASSGVLMLFFVVR